MTLPLQYRLVSSGDFLFPFLFICWLRVGSVELACTAEEWIVMDLVVDVTYNYTLVTSFYLP